MPLVIVGGAVVPVKLGLYIATLLALYAPEEPCTQSITNTPCVESLGYGAQRNPEYVPAEQLGSGVPVGVTV
jgi:hypothetical protein